MFARLLILAAVIVPTLIGFAAVPLATGENRNRIRSSRTGGAGAGGVQDEYRQRRDDGENALNRERHSADMLGRAGKAVNVLVSENAAREKTSRRSMPLKDSIHNCLALTVWAAVARLPLPHPGRRR